MNAGMPARVGPVAIAMSMLPWSRCAVDGAGSVRFSCLPWRTPGRGQELAAYYGHRISS